MQDPQNLPKQSLLDFLCVCVCVFFFCYPNLLLRARTMKRHHYQTIPQGPCSSKWRFFLPYWLYISAIGTFLYIRELLECLLWIWPSWRNPCRGNQYLKYLPKSDGERLGTRQESLESWPRGLSRALSKTGHQRKSSSERDDTRDRWEEAQNGSGICIANKIGLFPFLDIRGRQSWSIMWVVSFISIIYLSKNWGR